jgi:hypothetical protein
MVEKLQQSFSGGVISPALYHRQDIQRVQYGIKTSENGFITPEGNWMMRPGTHFTKQFNNMQYANRIIPLEISDSEKYILQFSPTKMRILNSDATTTNLDTNNLNEWSPLTLTKRKYTGYYNPFEYVKTGSGYTLKSGTAHMTIHSTSNTYIVSDTPVGLPCCYVQVAVNSSDNFVITETTYNTKPLFTFKFANTTGSKNSKSAVNSYLVANGSGFSLDISYWWVTTDSMWDGTLPTSNIVYDEFPYTEGAYRLNEFMNDLIYTKVGVLASIINPEITTDYDANDIQLIKHVHHRDLIVFVTGTKKPKVLKFYALDAFYLEDISLDYGPFFYSDSDLAIDKASGYGPSPFSGYKWGASNIYGANIKLNKFYPAYKYTGTVSTAITRYLSPIICNGTIYYSFTGSQSGTYYIKLYYATEMNLTVGTDCNWILGKEITVGTYGSFTFNEKCAIKIVIKNGGAGDSVSFELNTDAFAYESYGVIQDSQSYFTPITPPPSSVPTLNTVDAPNTNIDYDTIEIDAFNDIDGWPSVVYFYQNRLGFACTTSQPDTRWESQPGDYFNFKINNPVQPADAMNVDLPSESTETITNVISFRDLIIFTKRGEWSVIPDTAGYGPLNIPITRKSSGVGSGAIEPVIADRTIMYLQSGLSSLRAFDYTEQNDSYDNTEMQVFCRQYFNGYTFKRIVYQAKPWGIVWLLRSDGKLVSLTYSRQLQIAAFSIHDFGGVIHDIAVMSGDFDKLFIVVERMHYGLKTYEVEWLDSRNYTSITDAFFVDAGQTLTSQSPTKTWAETVYTDIYVYEGKTIGVLADGYKISGKTVTGQTATLTLDSNASKIQIGLPYTAKFEPLHQVVDRQGESGHAQKQKVSKVKVRWVDSVGGWVGPSEAEKIEVPARSTSIGSPEQPFTGWEEFDLLSRHSSENAWEASQFYHEQQSPLPSQIAGIIMNIE